MKTIFDFTAKVGGATYEIRPLSRETEASTGNVGHRIGAEGIIEVIPYSPPHRIAEILIHEILHALQWDRQIEFGEDRERDIDGLSHGIAAFIVDNPELCKTIGEYLIRSENNDLTEEKE